jgi:hypothetical protein
MHLDTGSRAQVLTALAILIAVRSLHAAHITCPAIKKTMFVWHRSVHEAQAQPGGADGVSRGDGVAAAALAALLLRVMKVYYRNSWLKLTLGC